MGEETCARMQFETPHPPLVEARADEVQGTWPSRVDSGEWHDASVEILGHRGDQSVLLFDRESRVAQSEPVVAQEDNRRVDFGLAHLGDDGRTPLCHRGLVRLRARRVHVVHPRSSGQLPCCRVALEDRPQVPVHIDDHEVVPPVRRAERKSTYDDRRSTRHPAGRNRRT